MEKHQKAMRGVRSFVCRQSRMTETQKQALALLEPQYAISLVTDASGHGSWIDCEREFGRSAPLVLEIGFGSGEALLSMAQAMPEKNFIGIEVHRPGVGSLLASLHRLALTNVRIIRADVLFVLAQAIASDSLDMVCIFFPDPWPKRRHHKRRLIQATFMDLLHRTMKKNAILHMATDSASYAEWMLRVLNEDPRFENKAGEKIYSERPHFRPITRFEQKGLAEGSLVRELVFSKK